MLPRKIFVCVFIAIKLMTIYKINNLKKTTIETKNLQIPSWSTV